MANELTTMSPANASTMIQHGGQQAAMSVSSLPQSAVGEEGNPVEQTDKVVKALNSDGGIAGAMTDRASREEIEKEAQELHSKELQERLASLSQLKGWTVQFSLEPELDKPLIKVIDVDTRQVIRQIPSEEVLLISKRLQALEQNQADGLSLSGLLFDDRV